MHSKDEGVCDESKVVTLLQCGSSQFCSTELGSAKCGGTQGGLLGVVLGLWILPAAARQSLFVRGLRDLGKIDQNVDRMQRVCEMPRRPPRLPVSHRLAFGVQLAGARVHPFPRDRAIPRRRPHPNTTSPNTTKPAGTSCRGIGSSKTTH